MATRSSVLAWTEEPGWLQYLGLQRLEHDWMTNISLFFCFLLLSHLLPLSPCQVRHKVIICVHRLVYTHIYRDFLCNHLCLYYIKHEFKLISPTTSPHWSFKSISPCLPANFHSTRRCLAPPSAIYRLICSIPVVSKLLTCMHMETTLSTIVKCLCAFGSVDSMISRVTWLTQWKIPWCWERLKSGGEGDDRGWDGWMASLTQWTRVWANSGRWWRTGKPGVLQSMGSQRVRQDLVGGQQDNNLFPPPPIERLFHIFVQISLFPW